MSATNPIVRALEKKLARCRVDAWSLILDELRPFANRVGWFHISIALADRDGRRVGGPVMTALVSGGGRGVKPWIEARFYPSIAIEGEKLIRIRTAGIEAELIAIIGEIIPPGGHLMIDYESGGQERTMRELQLGIPPAATALGARMLAAGFVGEFKDWYFSEGGHEGPRKLQANKPPDAAAARRAIAERIGELEEFALRGRARNHDAVVARALMRVGKLIDHLRKPRAARPTLEALCAIDVSPASTARPVRSGRASGRRRPPAPSR